MIEEAYTESEITQYLPVLWDDDLRLNGFAAQRRITSPDQALKGYRSAMSPELRTGYVNPKHTGDHMTMCADLQRAWELADLTLRQRQVLIMRYGLLDSQEKCATYFGNTQQSIQESEAAGVAKILAFLKTGKSVERSTRVAARRAA